MRKVIAKLVPFLIYGQPSLLRELASTLFVTREYTLGSMESVAQPVSRASVLMDTFVELTIATIWLPIPCF